jgi:hypothetical protein
MQIRGIANLEERRIPHPPKNSVPFGPAFHSAAGSDLSKLLQQMALSAGAGFLRGLAGDSHPVILAFKPAPLDLSRFDGRSSRNTQAFSPIIEQLSRCR